MSKTVTLVFTNSDWNSNDGVKAAWSDGYTGLEPGREDYVAEQIMNHVQRGVDEYVENMETSAEIALIRPSVMSRGVTRRNNSSHSVS